MLVRLLQSENELVATIVDRLLGILIVARFEHSPNVSCSIFVMPAPKVTLVSPLQFLNAESPIEVTLFGIVILVSLVQP